ncbi:hypothetical protein BD410DRAFT_789078 [Rickenella mellea]|uniref:Uncharacterized protein n=1 Tax=Rickenella mellea TaxID=50990 RepID=A0A4Y7Q2X1_9AGAM|nr:hypothetical protein BD410DRAFT_789078 [Rickenella mellea]
MRGKIAWTFTNVIRRRTSWPMTSSAAPTHGLQTILRTATLRLRCIDFSMDVGVRPTTSLQDCILGRYHASRRDYLLRRLLISGVPYPFKGFDMFSAPTEQPLHCCTVSKTRGNFLLHTRAPYSICIPGSPRAIEGSYDMVRYGCHTDVYDCIRVYGQLSSNLPADYRWILPRVISPG